MLNNLVLVSAYFLDGFATAAEQMCGRAVGAHDRQAFTRGVRLSIAWGFGLAFAVSLTILVAGRPLIALMTASGDVRLEAQRFLVFAAAAPLAGVLAYAFDGVYIGATWTRDLRNLMVASLLLYAAAWAALTPFGNAGLWSSIIAFLLARGLLQLARYPHLLRMTFSATAGGAAAPIP